MISQFYLSFCFLFRSQGNIVPRGQKTMNCSSWGTSESRSLSLEVDFLPQQCHKSKTLSFQFQEQDSSSIHSGQSSTVEMSVQHSSIGSTLGTTEGCVIRSFMQNQDFTFPPPLLDQSQTLAHYADPGYNI
ncbi:uncharacterized protein LOC114168476 [Vigna unguiculata]|uniref:uncharacterized protein LOC114168476 n=1 Tax=Vigna unguiculata TaxID=3917 RepID=UPI0010169D44|nr:uncharacterized protein LOC114168476 [Vigna unguiculata]